MKLNTFQGGIHPPYQKDFTAHKATEEAPLPDKVVIPLSQHVGAPNEPTVNVGDKVEAGQKIGESEAFISAPVHASVSGTVTAIEERMNFAGRDIKSIVIEVDPSQAITLFEDEPDSIITALVNGLNGFIVGSPCLWVGTTSWATSRVDWQLTSGSAIPANPLI